MYHEICICIVECNVVVCAPSDGVSSRGARAKSTPLSPTLFAPASQTDSKFFKPTDGKAAMPSSNPGVGARLCQLVSNSTTAVRYGTVRYIGPVEGTSGTWLGVEWDLDGKGKHDGSHGGERYFSCSRPGPIASFIRGEGGSLNVGGVTFLEALSEKYVANSSGSVTASTHTHQQQQYSRRNLADIEIEIPNIEKVSARVKNLHRLRTVALVGPIERTSSVGEEDNAPSRAELIEEIKWTVGHLGEDDSIAQSIADTIPSKCNFGRSRSPPWLNRAFSRCNVLGSLAQSL